MKLQEGLRKGRGIKTKMLGSGMAFRNTATNGQLSHKKLGVGAETVRKCAKRWNHSLNPALDRSEWSVIEVQTLIEATKTYGSHWKEIQKTPFPGRSANDVKNRHCHFSKSIDRAEQMSLGPIDAAMVGRAKTTGAFCAYA